MTRTSTLMLSRAIRVPQDFSKLVKKTLKLRATLVLKDFTSSFGIQFLTHFVTMRTRIEQNTNKSQMLGVLGAFHFNAFFPQVAARKQINLKRVLAHVGQMSKHTVSAKKKRHTNTGLNNEFFPIKQWLKKVKIRQVFGRNFRNM